jgi:dihydrofolate reductase
MPKLRVHGFTISLDGYGAGPNQGIDAGLGVGGEKLHQWMVATQFGHEQFGIDGPGSTGRDDEFARARTVNTGATVMGRNMFGPIRGDWGDDTWRGWWGDDPPYHHPVFVLTHHPHDPIEMDGGTTFHFVTDGIEAALEQAFAAAGGQDVCLGGGVSTVRQYLEAGLVDELHIPVAPVLLGGGERLFGDLPGIDRYEVVEIVSSPLAAHFVLARKA